MGIEEESEERQFIQHLITGIRCGVCGHYYKPGDVRILSHQRDLWLMAATCSYCQTQAWILAAITEAEAPEVIADVTPDEWARFQEMPQISADDVLDVHEFLKGFDGDLVELLRMGSSSED